MIYGGFALLNTFQPSRGVADAAHLGGMIFGYLYLQGGPGGLTAEIKYRYLKWKMNRLRRKFDVYAGGRIGFEGQNSLGRRSSRHGFITKNAKLAVTIGSSGSSR